MSASFMEEEWVFVGQPAPGLLDLLVDGECRYFVRCPASERRQFESLRNQMLAVLDSDGSIRVASLQ